jgi:hypothetical protein
MAAHDTAGHRGESQPHSDPTTSEPTRAGPARPPHPRPHTRRPTDRSGRPDCGPARWLHPARRRMRLSDGGNPSSGRHHLRLCCNHTRPARCESPGPRMSSIAGRAILFPGRKPVPSNTSRTHCSCRLNRSARNNSIRTVSYQHTRFLSRSNLPRDRHGGSGMKTGADSFPVARPIAIFRKRDTMTQSGAYFDAAADLPPVESRFPARKVSQR